MSKGLRKLLILIGLILALFTIGFVVWGETPAKPMPEALSALQSDNQVSVTTGKWLVFMPVHKKPSTALIIYPGGRVDYRAYAPAAHKIAADGYLVVIVRMPLNLAVFAPNEAANVKNSFPFIMHWAVGGHSLGGAMAASFAASYPGQVQGLVLWASYPAESLRNSGLQVVSIFGSKDGLATSGKIEESRALLPEDTKWVQIDGGNHAQFGWYGDQAGDNPAAISRPEQQAQLIKATMDLLESLK